MRFFKEKGEEEQGFGLGKLKSSSCEQEEHALSDPCTKGNVGRGRVGSAAPLEGHFPGATLGDPRRPDPSPADPPPPSAAWVEPVIG